MTTTTGKRILLGKKTENRRVWNIRGQPIKAIVGRAGTVIHAIGFELSSIHGGAGEREFRIEPASLPAVFGVCVWGGGDLLSFTFPPCLEVLITNFAINVNKLCYLISHAAIIMPFT